MAKKTILQKLTEYYETHTEEEIQEAWELTSKYDKINSPTVEKWLKNNFK